MEMSNQINISSHPLSDKEKYTISIKIQELLKKKVIIHSRPDVNKFISDIFTRAKKDDNKRMTLNLKMSIKVLKTMNIPKWNPSVLLTLYNPTYIWYLLT